jgi:alkylhydroperoxidase family enzyme
MSPRISPARAPFSPAVQAQLDRVMGPGRAPLVLFTTLARDERLFGRFMGGGLLDRGNLSLREREIVILRITSRSGSEYEWGVHAEIFLANAGLGPEDLVALTRGAADDPRWDARERVLIEACDRLHETCDIDDALWARLAAGFTSEALIEVLMLAGFYRTVSYLTNALRLPLEAGAPRFPAR